MRKSVKLESFSLDVSMSLNRKEISGSLIWMPQNCCECSSGANPKENKVSPYRMQCATLMYERTAHSKQRVASTVLSLVQDGRTQAFSHRVDPTIPGARIRALCGITGADSVIEQIRKSRIDHEEETIQDIASKYLGLQFLTVSELNCLGSSYCGLFWDPEDNFIIVGFRGTNATDFTEWNTDFTFQMHEAGQWLRGFGKGRCACVILPFISTEYVYVVQCMTAFSKRFSPPRFRDPCPMVSSSFCLLLKRAE